MSRKIDEGMELSDLLYKVKDWMEGLLEVGREDNRAGMVDDIGRTLGRSSTKSDEILLTRWIIHARLSSLTWIIL